MKYVKASENELKMKQNPSNPVNDINFLKSDIKTGDNTLFQRFQPQFCFTRLSISWSRILPTGFVNETNQAGIDHYLDLLKVYKFK